MDVSDLLVAKSDQLNADDLTGGPITVRILGVRRRNTAEQPLEIEIEGYRPWRPCKTTARILAAGWTAESDAWVGRTIRLFRDPNVLWAGVKVGGIRISGMSDILPGMSVTLTATKGKKGVVKETYQIEQLPSAPAVVRPDLLAVLTDAGLTVADFNRYRGEKPGYEALTPAQREQIAAWFLAIPGRLAPLKPAAQDAAEEYRASLAEGGGFSDE